MAQRALDRFPRPAHDKRLASGEAPDWHIRCEGRSRVTAFKAKQIVGDLYDPRSDRLALSGFHRSPKQNATLVFGAVSLSTTLMRLRGCKAEK
jgi:hypothetical protein